MEIKKSVVLIFMGKNEKGEILKKEILHGLIDNSILDMYQKDKGENIVETEIKISCVSFKWNKDRFSSYLSKIRKDYKYELTKDDFIRFALLSDAIIYLSKNKMSSDSIAITVEYDADFINNNLDEGENIDNILAFREEKNPICSLFESIVKADYYSYITIPSYAIPKLNEKWRMT